MLIKQMNRQKLTPLASTPPLVKTKARPAKFVSQYYQRYRTEGNDTNNSVFPLHLSAQRHHSASQRDTKKQYNLIRKYELRNSNEKQRIKLRSGDISLPLKKKSLFDLESFEQKIVKKPIFSQNVNNIKIKDLQCNILHLLRIFQKLLKKKDHQTIIEGVKFYILEQESDLNQLQLCLAEQKDQLTTKFIIYHERILLILLIQSIINKRYRFNQQNFMQLFKELVNFYSLIYFQLTQQSLEKIIETYDLKAILPHLPQRTAQPDLVLIKDCFGKKITAALKPFTQLDQFVRKQSVHMKNFPSNLLYYNLLQFYAGRLTGGDWTGWGIQFLQTCPSPYIHHTTDKKYTLLLDLDQTLVHYRTTSANRGQFLLRPHLFSFLSKLEPYYELGIFTCALQGYADLILQHMPSIKIKLYRQHAVRVGKQLVKDLSRVGRDLSKVILVDNLDKNFQLQKQNGIHVRSWFGDSGDNILEQLAIQLQRLAKNRPSDIRTSIHSRSFL